MCRLCLVTPRLRSRVFALPATSSSQKKADCPPTQYSCLHYLTPNLYRVYEQCHGPKVGLIAPDRYPQFPLHYEITTSPLPDDAAQFHSATVLLRDCPKHAAQASADGSDGSHLLAPRAPLAATSFASIDRNPARIAGLNLADYGRLRHSAGSQGLDKQLYPIRSNRGQQAS